MLVLFCAVLRLSFLGDLSLYHRQKVLISEVMTASNGLSLDRPRELRDYVFANCISAYYAGATGEMYQKVQEARFSMAIKDFIQVRNPHSFGDARN